MRGSPINAEESEWDVVVHPGSGPWGQQHDDMSVVPRNPASQYQRKSTSRISFILPQTKSNRFFLTPKNHSAFSQPTMAPPLTLEELEEIRERDRQEKRVKGLAWAFTGVHHSNEHQDSSSPSTSGNLALQTKSPEIRDFERQQERVTSLGWAFSEVHVSSAHEDWTKMTAAEKEAVQKSLSMSRENLRVE